ncbi:hypothetical protein EW146_g6395 [Bondarzewia mesenterica]|uniref:Uncharacterized protein n=1 Tax=Bondarzewia mesenterica TaxID=1095465 RepID=A0A4V3XEJ2_9AGAM|nr:hypothetical protein EW146_g6395 [Bondarzewia mesenterica]
MRSLPQILRNEFPAKLLDHTLDNAWNWEAIGVSKTLWDMVCIGLGAGLGREALLQILRGTQEEASGAVTGKPEEDEERAVEMDLQHPDDADADGSPAHETHKEVCPSFLDLGLVSQPFLVQALPQSYTTTWKPHAAVEDHSMNGQQPEASTSSAAASSSVAVAPPPQGSLGTIPPVYGYLQGAPYMQSAYGPYPYIYQHADPNVPGPSTSSKRAGEALSVEPPSKRIRHCVKCGSKDCKGKGGRNFCTNACQDCGKMECKGRNSKRPDKTCIDAWQ